MLVSDVHVGKRKVRLVAERLERAGFNIDLVERRFSAGHCVLSGEPATALIGMDNLAARRDLDTEDRVNRQMSGPHRRPRRLAWI